MAVKFANNAKTTLSAGINSSVTSIVVVDGSVFPALSGADYFYLTFEDVSLNREVVKVTARSGNTLTVVRAQDGTTARSFSLADKVELRITVAGLMDLIAPADLLSALLTVDGPGSALDADLFDGLNSTAYAQLAVANVFTATQTINNNSSAVPSPGTTGVALHLTGADGVSTRLWLDSFAIGTNYTARRANGTNAAKTTLIGGDVIMNNTAFGYDGTAYSTSAQAAFQIAASQTWAVGAHGTRMIFQVVPDNSTTLTPRWVMEQDGSLMYSGATATGASTVNALNYFVAGTNISSIYQTIAGYTAADVLSKLLTVDGAGSGLDADLLDGYSSASFARLADTASFTAAQTIAPSAHTGGSGLVGVGEYLSLSGFAPNIVFTDLSASVNPWFVHYNSGIMTIGETVASVATTRLALTTSTIQYNGSTVWHAGNDGAGSGLDADLLDGQSGAYYQTASGYTAADVLSKLLTVDGAGSGLDADLLDGLNSAAFGQLTAANVWTNNNTISRAGVGDILLTLTAAFPTSGSRSMTVTNPTTDSASEPFNVNTGNSLQFNIDTIARYLLNVSGDSLFTPANFLKSTITSAGATTSPLFAVNESSAASTAVQMVLQPSTSTSRNVLLRASNSGAEALTFTLLLSNAGSAVTAFTINPTLTFAFAGASGTIAGNTIWHAGNDGAGSGLDADLWDGNNFATYIDQTLTTTSTPRFAWIHIGTDTDLRIYESSTNVMTLRAGGVGTETYVTIGASNTFTVGGYNIYHTANDGAGSGLDADLWDGNQFATYLNQALLTTSAPTFAGATLTAGLAVTSTAPSLVLLENDQGTDLKRWDILATAGTLLIRMVNDANSLATNLVTITRTSTYTAATWNYAATTTLQYNSNTIWHAGNDGAGSGLDADLLDGNNIGTSGATIPLLNGANTYSGVSTYTAAILWNSTPLNSRTLGMPWAEMSSDASGNSVHGNNIYANWDGSVVAYKTVNTHASVGYGAIRFGYGAVTIASFGGATTAGATVTPTWNTLWHAGNDGAGSGLDADLWDGNNFASYLNQAVLTTSTPTFGGVNLTSTSEFLPQATITNTHDGANAGYVIFYKSPADTLVSASDYIGTILWYGRGSSSTNGTAATIYARAEGTRGTNWVAADLVLGSISTAGTYRYLALNAVGTMTWNSSTVWTAANDGAGSGLDADTLDSYNVGTSGATIPLLSTNNTYSGISAFTGQVTMSRGAVPLQITTTVDNGNVEGMIVEGDRATPTANDIVYMNWRLSNSAGTQTEFGRQSIVASTVTAASEVSYWMWAVQAAGTLTNVMRLSSAALTPNTNDGIALGNTSLMWSDLFLASGGVVNFNNGDVTITHSADTLAFAGAATGYTFDGPMTISSTAANNPLVITSTEAGATAFTVDLFRNSASPAAADGLAALRFRGRNSTPATVTYSSIQSTIVDPTAASEDANLFLQTIMAGTLVNALTLGQSTIEHRFTTPTDSIVSSQGTNGYGAFLARGSGTNAAYIFLSNITSSERGRIWATNNADLMFSTNAGVTAHLAINSAGAVTASNNTVWHAGNDGAGSLLDADLLDGLNSTVFVYGINGSGSTGANATQTFTELAQYKSGFWDVTGAAWTPNTGYWWGITMAHISNGPAYNFGGQIIIQNSAGTPAAYLRSISGGATPAATAWQQIWTSAVDGSGSGLDADLLDGLNSTQFVRADSSTILTTGVLVTTILNSSTTLSGQSTTLAGGLEVRGNGTGPALMSFHRPSAWAAHIGIDTDNIWKVGGWSMGANAYPIWHSGVDGSGSGLDADTVDGYHMNQNVLTSSSPSFVDVTITSDERLKSDIIPIASALEKVRKLRGAEYTRRATGKREIGVIAQDLEAAGLELLVDRTESNLRTVKYMRLSAVLIEAVKELAERVEQLERAA